jgi:hypothetical protein
MGGPTSYTQQSTPGKNSLQTARKRPKILPECSSNQSEQTQRGKLGKIKTSTWKAQGG